MIQLREIRENPEHFIDGAKNKCESVDIKKIFTTLLFEESLPIGTDLCGGLGIHFKI